MANHDCSFDQVERFILSGCKSSTRLLSVQWLEPVLVFAQPFWVFSVLMFNNDFHVFMREVTPVTAPLGITIKPVDQEPTPLLRTESFCRRCFYDEAVALLFGFDCEVFVHECFC